MTEVLSPGTRAIDPRAVEPPNGFRGRRPFNGALSGTSDDPGANLTESLRWLETSRSTLPPPSTAGDADWYWFQPEILTFGSSSTNPWAPVASTTCVWLSGFLPGDPGAPLTGSIHLVRGEPSAALDFSGFPGSLELRELAALEGDWDTYGGLPPTAAALRGAHRLLEIVHNLYPTQLGGGMAPYAVSPLPTAGVELEWRMDCRLIRVDVGPDGEFDYLERRDVGDHRQYTEQHGCSLHEVLAALHGVLSA